MNSIEKNYAAIATVLAKLVQSPWDSLALLTKVLNSNCSHMIFVRRFDSNEERLDPSFEDVFVVNDACVFLRDDLLATTSKRIWGLTFTLYPDGKFNIEYDYNKPEGYEETDETMTLDEALSGLKDMGVKIEGTGQ